MYLNCAYCEVVYCEIRLLRTTFWSPKSYFTELEGSRPPLCSGLERSMYLKRKILTSSQIVKYFSGGVLKMLSHEK